MYCIRCGVKLADTEKVCPLCETTVYHPEIELKEGESLYPRNRLPITRKKTYIPEFIVTFMVVLSAFIVLLCDLQIFNAVTWSGYVVGGLILGYVSLVLPSWFKRPNPVIFVPIDFVVLGAYLLYIDLYTGGGWFLSFVFPLVCGLGVMITALVVLLRYIKHGRLYIFGGFFVILGVYMLPIEYLANITFKIEKFLGWSLYPMVSLVMLGGLLIFLGIYRPAREYLERKFYI